MTEKTKLETLKDRLAYWEGQKLMAEMCDDHRYWSETKEADAMIAEIELEIKQLEEK